MPREKSIAKVPTKWVATPISFTAHTLHVLLEVSSQVTDVLSLRPFASPWVFQNIANRGKILEVCKMHAVTDGSRHQC